MTVADILARLFNDKGATSERIVKAQGAAKRSNLEWSAVLAAMTPEQRALMEGL